MKVPLHSTADASSLAALLIGQILRAFFLFAPCGAGASTVSVQRGTLTASS